MKKIFVFILCAWTFTAVTGQQAFSQEKPTISIMDLQCQGLSQTDVVLITDRLLSEIKKSGNYEVIERSKRDEVLREQSFAQSGACDEASCLIEAGKLLAAQKMIGGSIGQLGNLWVVNIRMINVKTGSVDKTVDRDYQGPKESLLVLMKECAGILTEKDILLPEEKALLAQDRAQRSAIDSMLAAKRFEGMTEEQKKIAEAETKRAEELAYQAAIQKKAEDEAALVRVKELEKKLQQGQKEREKKAREQAKIEEKARNKRLMEQGYIKPYRKTSKILFWSGTALCAASGVFKVLAEREYDKYEKAELKVDAIDAMNKTKKWDKTCYITGGGAVACLLTSGALYLAGNKRSMKLSMMPTKEGFMVSYIWRY